MKPGDEDLREYWGDMPSLQYLYGLQMGYDRKPFPQLGWTKWHFMGYEDAQGELDEEDD